MTSEMLYNYVTCFKNTFSISGDLRLSCIHISLISDTGPILAIREPCPLARSWRLIVSMNLLWEKNSKIFFSETTGHTALIFCMWQWLMVLYINCASHAPGVKFGHAPGVDSLHRLTMGKTKKNFFSETKRPRASIFCM